MKLFKLIACLIFLSTFFFGQIFVGGLDLNSADSIRIVEVYVNRRALRNIVHVSVDFGQRDNVCAECLGTRGDNLVLEPETKRKMAFVSTAGMLNFFERNGGEYVNGFADIAPHKAGYYYHFRKRQVK